MTFPQISRICPSSSIVTVAGSMQSIWLPPDVSDEVSEDDKLADSPERTRPIDALRGMSGNSSPAVSLVIPSEVPNKRMVIMTTAAMLEIDKIDNRSLRIMVLEACRKENMAPRGIKVRK